MAILKSAPNYISKNDVSAGQIPHSAFNSTAKANKTLDVLVVPSLLIADATTATEVGKGSLLRVKGAANQFLTFGDVSVGVPTISTNDTIETPADFFFIVATDSHVRTSSIMRIEVVRD